MYGTGRRRHAVINDFWLLIDVVNRCLEYMESLINLLIGHPEVKLCEDVPENFNISVSVCSVMLRLNG